MILSTLLKPPGAPPEESPGAVRRERRVPTLTRQRERRYRRIVSVGVILSVVVHVVAVRLSPLVVRYLEPDLTAFRAQQPPRSRPEGMEVVMLRITETVPVEPQPEPEPEPEPEPAVAEEPEGEVGPVPTAAERLRPRVGDWRLWVVPPLRRRAEASLAERTAEVNSRLRSVLEAYDDSVAAEAARRAEALDWTVGKEGNKWGISPGGIHLGPITLPIPLSLGAHPATQREEAARQAEYDAIRRQAGQGVIDETFEERVKAIRERKAREEAEKKANEKAEEDSTSGG